jgi:ERCC4-type nuclease
VIVAPTEPAALRALGVVKNTPEAYGVDFLWAIDDGLAGVQRKEVKDLIASTRDGRLGKELQQMKALAWRGLVIEGEMKWTLDGALLGSWGKTFTRSAYLGLLASVQASGCAVFTARDHADTAAVLTAIKAWTEKEKHGSLSTRPPMESKGMAWGMEATNRDFQVHLLTGLPGVGVELAGRIIDKFGGVPWAWTVTKAELAEVEGIGKKKIERLFSVLPLSVRKRYEQPS